MTLSKKNYLNPLLQNIHFPFQKLNPIIQWQNTILHDLKMLYEDNADYYSRLLFWKIAHISIIFSEI